MVEHKPIYVSGECHDGHHLDFDLIKFERQLSANEISSVWKGTYEGKSVAIKMVCHIIFCAWRCNGA